MLSPSASGFGWNDDGKFVTCPQSIWDEWIKSHKNAAGLRNKPFPFYDTYGKYLAKIRLLGMKLQMFMMYLIRWMKKTKVKKNKKSLNILKNILVQLLYVIKQGLHFQQHLQLLGRKEQEPR